jgi:hypothetical protein
LRIFIDEMETPGKGKVYSPGPDRAGVSRSLFKLPGNFLQLFLRGFRPEPLLKATEMSRFFYFRPNGPTKGCPQGRYPLYELKFGIHLVDRFNQHCFLDSNSNTRVKPVGRLNPGIGLAGTRAARFGGRPSRNLSLTKWAGSIQSVRNFSLRTSAHKRYRP